MPTEMSRSDEIDMRRDLITLNHANAIFDRWRHDDPSQWTIFYEEDLPKALLQERITDMQNLKELAERRLARYMEKLNG